MTSRRNEGRKPRLLVLTSTYPRWPGDPEPGFVHELARRLVRDFDVTVLGPHAPGAQTAGLMDGIGVRRYRYAPAPLETLVNDGGIATNLKRQPWKWLLVPGFILGGWLSLWRLVRSLEPDVIHAHWLVPQGLMVATLGMVSRRVPPFLVTSHGADLYAFRGGLLARMKRFVVRRAAAATVVSEAMRDELARLGANPGKVEVQPMGVDFDDRFVPGEARRSRDELLFVGRLVEKKGLRHLLDAMPRVLEAHPRAFLTVAGFGPEAAERTAQARRLGIDDRVRFVGAVAQADLPELYRRAAVFVAPFVRSSSGDQEGLGLVLVEAIACGCPVVVSDLPAVQQVLGGDAAAVRVPPADPDALAAALVEMLSRPPSAPELATRRKRLERQFGWPRVAEGYSALLRACAGGSVEEGHGADRLGQ